MMYQVILTILLLSLCREKVICQSDEMDEFPLDEVVEFDNETEDQSVTNQDTKDSGNRKAEQFNRLINAAMKRPEARQKVAQVLPIIRGMNPSQRLVLAAMVMKQLKPEASPDVIDMNDNKTAELMIPISADIAAMFRGLVYDNSQLGRSSYGPIFYNPLSTGIRIHGPHRPLLLNVRRYQPPNIIKKSDVPPEMKPPPLSPPSNNTYAIFNTQDVIEDEDEESSENSEESDDSGTNDEECNQYSDSLCLNVNSYPTRQIGISIRNLENKHVFRALLEDYASNVTDVEPQLERRQGSENEKVGKEFQICSSKIKYARPKKAKSMNGQWKFVVNTQQYTQTVRIETCLNYNKPCSYLNDNVKSHCAQVYNYHRLLTWDDKSGLSLDLFKIPTCCSCQIQDIQQYGQNVGTKSDAGLQDNIIEDTSVFHAPAPKPKTKNKVQYNPPKQELIGRVRRPQAPVQYEGNDFRQSNRLSQFENSNRRTSTKNNGLRDSYSGKGTYAEEFGETTTSRRINYNYHPIIDFFKTPSPPEEAAERFDTYEEWLPLTEGPRALPK